MAVGTILIHRLSFKHDIGYYEISTDDFDVNNFYVSIDKSKKIIKFFLIKNFNSDPIHSIDYNKDEPIGSIPGIPMKVFTVVLMRTLEVFRTNTFPEYLSYAA